jgi:hypothetical protein
MRGDDQQQSGMFSYVSLEEMVPQDHPLRAIRKSVKGGAKVDHQGGVKGDHLGDCGSSLPIPVVACVYWVTLVLPY